MCLRCNDSYGKYRYVAHENENQDFIFFTKKYKDNAFNSMAELKAIGTK